eukprot:jgi/Chlat1/7245/Chrsp58S06888
MKTREEYREWSRKNVRPPDIPGDPAKVYKNAGWISWMDFLGTCKGRPAHVVFRPFEEARAYVWTLGIKSIDDYYKWAASGARPPDIPSNPDKAYRGQYISAPDCRSGQRPPDIPGHPCVFYSDKGWISWPDWLGTEKGKPKQLHGAGFRTFAEAREYVWTLTIKSEPTYAEWSKSGGRPRDIPACPHLVYKDQGWLSWADFLGTAKGQLSKPRPILNKHAPEGVRPYAEACQLVRWVGLKHKRDYDEWVKSGEAPADMPLHPNKVYRNLGWTTWGEFFGTSAAMPAVLPTIFRPFEDARELIWSLELKSLDDYRAWCRSGERPEDIPVHPETVYVDKGWLSWPDWLGVEKGRPGPRYAHVLAYEEAKEVMRFEGLGLRAPEQYYEWWMRGDIPEGLPQRPYDVYKRRGWVSWDDFLSVEYAVEDQDQDQHQHHDQEHLQDQLHPDQDQEQIQEHDECQEQEQDLEQVQDQDQCLDHGADDNQDRLHHHHKRTHDQQLETNLDTYGMADEEDAEQCAKRQAVEEEEEAELNEMVVVPEDHVEQMVEQGMDEMDALAAADAEEAAIDEGNQLPEQEQEQGGAAEPEGDIEHLQGLEVQHPKHVQEQQQEEEEKQEQLQLQLEQEQLHQS